MISRYFGREVPVQYWRSLVNTNREGTSLFDLASGCEKAGFVTQAVALNSFSDLGKDLFPLIMIRQWHYYVVYEMKGDTLILGDPAVGLRQMKIKEFMNGLENAALLLKPTDDFLNTPEVKNSYAHFLHLFDGLGKEIGLALGASFLWVLISLFPPILSQIILDEVLAKRDQRLLAYALITALGVVILDSIVRWAKNYYINYLGTKITYKSHSVFLKKLMSLPYGYFANHHAGDFSQRLGELDKVRNFLTNTLLNLVSNFVFLVVYFAFLSLYSIKITLIVLALSPFFVLVPLLFSKKLSQSYQRFFSASCMRDGLLTDIVKGIATVKTTGSEVASQWRYSEKLVESLIPRQLFSNLSATLKSVFGGLLLPGEICGDGIGCVSCASGRSFGWSNGRHFADRRRSFLTSIHTESVLGRDRGGEARDGKTE